MRKNHHKPLSLGEVLEGFLRRSGLRRRIQEQKILDLWEGVVGQAVAERTEPIRVQNRVLQVKVDNSVWMQQLQFMKSLILKKFQEQSGDNFLQDLRFFVGELNHLQEGKNEKTKRGRESSDETIKEEKRRWIEKEVAGVRDPEMREILSEVQDGTFAREWILENQAGRPVFNAIKRMEAQHPIEVVGKQLRGMMSWLGKKS